MKPIVRQVQPSVTMSLDQQARALAAAGRDIINLTAGQVDFPMPEEAPVSSCPGITWVGAPVPSAAVVLMPRSTPQEERNIIKEASREAKIFKRTLFFIFLPFHHPA